eukprot:sb/3476131/
MIYSLKTLGSFLQSNKELLCCTLYPRTCGWSGMVDRYEPSDCFSSSREPDDLTTRDMIRRALRSFAAKSRTPPFLHIFIAPSFQLLSKNDLQVFERSRQDLRKTWGSFRDLMQSKGVTAT